MAVCCGQSPWIHSIPSLLLPQSYPDVYPTSLPSPSGARGHSVSLLALTVVLALITYSTGGESTSLYIYVRITTELTHCVLCVLLYSSTVIAFPVCHERCLEKGKVTLRPVGDLVLSIITMQEHQEWQRI